ncbi:esterase-like activity of phytase family protein [Parvularcula lutaonensis]|uniref:Esterase-like activity of phytase family protein n=1 Tax=Parvularcula lutaonensis TaxID=491923 RepID=A0ABV7MBA1_9PROT|nr:esterase-like activity of phytase family protein [Parvularcula lutaonensis]GGY40073.1 hypothetical protein GCM10007148_05660 [Parvularcula lutaonensis]
MIGLFAAAFFALSPGEPIEIDVRFERFSGLRPAGREIGCMTMTSGTTAYGPPQFGGYSGIDLDTENKRAVFLSDRGQLWFADVVIGEHGKLQLLSNHVIRYFQRDKLAPGGGKDTEALVPYKDGWLITRERDNDAVYAEVLGREMNVLSSEVDLSFVRGLSRNTGFEAAARVSDDEVVFISECKIGGSRAPIVLWDGDEPTLAGYYRTERDFAVTDATADPDTDRLFVLERAYDRFHGPRAKVKVLRISDLRSLDGGDVRARNLGRLNVLDGADNMEGIAFYRSADGGENLLLVSDDNFNPVQRTVLMTLRLSGSCALSPAQAGDGADEAAERAVEEKEDG